MNVTRYHEILRGMGVTPFDAEKCGCGSCKGMNGRQEQPARTIPEPLAERVAIFRAQLAAWAASGRWAVPFLTLPGVEPAEGRCWSCGDAVTPGRWRCAPCVEAVELALKESA